MNVDRVVVFDLKGDCAHFKKIYTTTSALTYSIPTGTVLAGLVGAILGLERDSFYDEFTSENCALGTRILSPIKKFRMNLNQIDTKKGFYLWDIKRGKRTQIPTEFIKNPEYRVYLCLKSREMQSELKERLKDHRSVYTPYLGISELIADLSYVGEFPAKLVEISGKEKIHSVIRRGSVNIAAEEKLAYGKDRIPLRTTEGGTAKEFADVIYERNGKPMTAIDGKFYSVGEDNVTFL